MTRALILAALLTCASFPVAAQGPARADRDAASLSARDSARLLRSARQEQSRFELVRRRHLPWAWGGGSGACHERIGRFCLTHDDRDDREWTPPPEEPEVAAARERLLARLDSAARLIPGDAWVAGQRVRYLVEDRRHAEASAAAADCRAEQWWCQALRGFALHYAGEAGAADSAFAAMLAAMPEADRRAWTDLSDVLDDAPRRVYRRLPDDSARARFEARFWRLADPFFSRPGNALRAEHFARNLWDQLQDRAKNTESLSWGDDLREILIRYGWPAGWERIREPYRIGGGPVSMVTHYANAEQHLLPPPELLADAADLDAGEWDTEPLRAQAAYNLPLADSTLRWIHPLPHQLAVFQRGDSAVVVGAYELPGDSFPDGARVAAGLAALAEGEREPSHSGMTEAPLSGALSLVVAPRPQLLSLELLSTDARRAARARRGVRLEPAAPGTPAVSDLLLLRAAETLPDSLSGAVALARGSSRVRPGEEVGLFWEVYGLEGAGPNLLTLSLRLLSPEAGWVRQLAERIGIVRDQDPIRMQWQEQAGSAGVFPRALLVQVPPELKPGTYTLELAVELIGHEPLRVRRELVVEDP